jgi:hypothetical protein
MAFADMILIVGPGALIAGLSGSVSCALARGIRGYR